MASQTTYEVYVLQGSRWEIHSRFPAHKMDDAIQDAKTQEKNKSIEAVKVVKDSYDPEQGVSKESIVYKSPGVKPEVFRESPAASSEKSSPPAKSSGASDGPSRARFSGRGGGSNPFEGKGDDLDDDGDDEDTPKKKKKKKEKPPKVRTPGKRGLGGFTKLGLITFFSIGVAILLTMGSTMLLQQRTLFGVVLTADIRANILFAVFVASFLFTIIPMCRSFISMEDFSSGPAKPRTPRAPRPAVPAPVKLDLPPPPPLEDISTSAEPEPIPVSEPEPEAEPEQEALPDPEPPVSPAVERQKVFMMKFLGDSLQGMKTNNKTLDSMGKFGMNLYLAGAVEALSTRNNLDEVASRQVLSESVQVLGYKPEQANQFAEKADGYLLADAKYMQMYDAGRNAMMTTLDGDEAGGAKSLDRAMTDWIKPTDKKTKTGPVTVIFTDMVGSTALTQEKGDAVAQEVVRGHNRIVRQALQQFMGKEIKHTGDGIMCSFAQTSNGVEAACQIMKGVREFRQMNPDLPLHLKIGINTGEPIAEDDDLFGTTVQLSARITDKAKAGQIFVSEIVKGICTGKPIKFIPRGGFEMKGFAEPVPLYEVVWDETGAAHAPATGAPPPAASAPAPQKAKVS